MSARTVDYNRLAAGYDGRYQVEPLQEIADALIELVQSSNASAVLEVGCGTGHWLRQVQANATLTIGADASIEMIRKGANRVPVAAARANALPFALACFDVIYCVNALHHFDDPARFIRQAAELLKADGKLAIIGIDPRLIQTRYFYTYFKGTLDIDMQRYASTGDLVDWMCAAGFDPVEYRVVHTWTSSFKGREVFSDPFLPKESHSLFALLSDDEYQAGIRNMESAIAKAESAGDEIFFDTTIPFGMLTGTLRPS